MKNSLKKKLQAFKEKTHAAARKANRNIVEADDLAVDALFAPAQKKE